MTRIKNIGNYASKIRLKRKNKVIKTEPLLTGYREIGGEIGSVVGHNRTDCSGTARAVM